MNWPISQRCVSTLGFPECDFSSLSALCRDFSIPMVELRAIEDRLDLPAWFQEHYQTPQRLQAALADLPFRIQVLDSSFSLAGGKEGARDELVALAEWADALGVPWIRVFDGGRFDPEAPADAFQPHLESILWWRRLRRDRGWKTDLLVETHDLICSTANCLRLQTLLDQPVALLWDAWHLWYKNHEALEDTWAALHPFIRHIHFKEGTRSPILQYSYSYCLPGSGEFPLAKLFQILAEASYSGPICLEWERKWHPYLPPLRDALQALLPAVPPS